MGYGRSRAPSPGAVAETSRRLDKVSVIAELPRRSDRTSCDCGQLPGPQPAPGEDRSGRCRLERLSFERSCRTPLAYLGEVDRQFDDRNRQPARVSSGRAPNGLAGYSRGPQSGSRTSCFGLVIGGLAAGPARGNHGGERSPRGVHAVRALHRAASDAGDQGPERVRPQCSEICAFDFRLSYFVNRAAEDILVNNDKSASLPSSSDPFSFSRRSARVVDRISRMACVRVRACSDEAHRPSSGVARN